MSKPKILAFAGSARKDSYNKQLIRLASAAAEKAGAEVTLIDLADYPMPLFDQDLESASGLPANAMKLKELFLQHAGLMIASPEYNSSITPLLKNTIDWVSRQAPGEGSLAAYQGKVAALMSASPGGLGGLRGLVHVRSILGNIGVLVIPNQLAISKAHEMFAKDGTLRDDSMQSKVAQVAESLTSTLIKLQG